MILRVTCAILVQGNHILLAQRSPEMSPPLKWEFPGGKAELGESDADCIVREIREELGLEVKVLQQLPSHLHHDGIKTIELIPFICSWESGELKLAEHIAVAWVTAEEALQYDLADADVPILQWLLASPFSSAGGKG